MSSASRAVGAPDPFWLRIPSIATYPVRGSALITLLVLTFCAMFAFVPVLGWLVSIATWLGAYKYAFEILRNSANGYDEAPEVAFSVEDGVVWRMFGLNIVYGILVLVAFGIGGAKLGLLAMCAVVVLQPGAVMSLAMDGSLSHALNPATALSLIARIGWPYLAVVGLLFVIQSSALFAGAWLAAHLPMIVDRLVLMFFVFWGMFATFHLMGYLLFQYHAALGFEPRRIADALPVRDDGGVLEQAQAFVREGRTAEALAVLREEVRSRTVSADTHELYRRLLRQSGDVAAAQEHARQCVQVWMHEGQERRALGLMREALDADPDFVPHTPEHGDRLAELARLGGQSQLALDLLQAMLRRFPNAPEMPRRALQAALLLSERFGRDGEAKALLEVARVRCEDEATLAKIDTLLKALP